MSRVASGTRVRMSRQPAVYSLADVPVPVPYAIRASCESLGRESTSEFAAVLAASMRGPGASEVSIESDASTISAVGEISPTDADDADFVSPELVSPDFDGVPVVLHAATAAHMTTDRNRTPHVPRMLPLPAGPASGGQLPRDSSPSCGDDESIGGASRGFGSIRRQELVRTADTEMRESARGARHAHLAREYPDYSTIPPQWKVCRA